MSFHLTLTLKELEIPSSTGENKRFRPHRPDRKKDFHVSALSILDQSDFKQLRMLGLHDFSAQTISILIVEVLL